MRKLFTAPRRAVTAAAIALALAATAPVAAGAATAGGPAGGWTSAGQGLANARSQPFTTLSNSGAAALAPAWTYTTHGDVSATPDVYDGVVYVPDWGGYLNAISAADGTTLWSDPISSYDGVSNSVARDTPAVFGNEIILGDQNGAHVFAVNRLTGKLIWSTQVDTHQYAVITANPVVFDGRVYVGVSSLEEGAARNPNYQCCTFRGSMVALNAATGAIDWKTYTVPANGGQPGGYSGGAVWDTPAISPASGLIYFGTGNNYSVPASVVTCENNANPPGSGNCTAPNDYFDSIMALNLRTGAVAWTSKTMAYDAWTAACIGVPPGVTWCPSPSGPDYDMGGSGPNLMNVSVGGTMRQIVGIGQKSGIYWAFDAATGQSLWHTLVGPGSALGGMEWGTAFDGSRIYVAIGNSYHIPYHPTSNGVLDTSVTLTGGSWAALNPATGQIEWQTGDPNGAIDLGAVSTAGGVVFGGSMDGTMYALNGATGQIEWSFASGGSVNSGAAIVGGDVFWGSGYSHFGLGTGNDKLYMFSSGG